MPEVEKWRVSDQGVSELGWANDREIEGGGGCWKSDRDTNGGMIQASFRYFQLQILEVLGQEIQIRTLGSLRPWPFGTSSFSVSGEDSLYWHHLSLSFSVSINHA